MAQKNDALPGEPVGTIVGESTTQMFRMALGRESARVQDLVAVDAYIEEPSQTEQTKAPKGEKPTQKPKPNVRIWARIEEIERLNPLFPREAAQELANLGLDPYQTVISLSREMVTATCSILGYEDLSEQTEGLRPLRYPPKPASRVYRPPKEKVERMLMTPEAAAHPHRRLDIGTLSTRNDVRIYLDGQAIVARHLAILAMTGAGKSWTARRIIEELARRGYPILIFDPHGEYGGFEELPEDLQIRVRYFRSRIDVFQEDFEMVVNLIASLAKRELTPPMESVLRPIYFFARKVFRETEKREKLRDLIQGTLSEEGEDLNEEGKALKKDIENYGLQPNLFGLYHLTRYIQWIVQPNQKKPGSNLKFKKLQDFFKKFSIKASFSLADVSAHEKSWEGLIQRLRDAAHRMHDLERQTEILTKQTKNVEELPFDLKAWVAPNQIAIFLLEGYPHEFWAAIYQFVLGKLFDARLQGKIPYPFFVVVEEAHNFTPSRQEGLAEHVHKAAISLTRQVASEGRKFGVGLMLISQRPSRIDQTVLSQMNSFVIMRIVNPDDQRYVKAVVETLGEEQARLLPNLAVGEALLTGQFLRFPVLAQIEPPRTKGKRQETDFLEQVASYNAQAGL